MKPPPGLDTPAGQGKIRAGFDTAAPLLQVGVARSEERAAFRHAGGQAQQAGRQAGRQAGWRLVAGLGPFPFLRLLPVAGSSWSPRPPFRLNDSLYSSSAYHDQKPGPTAHYSSSAAGQTSLHAGLVSANVILKPARLGAAIARGEAQSSDAEAHMVGAPTSHRGAWWSYSRLDGMAAIVMAST
ncbi:uncharacterized protein PSFLO_01114 [Pseudozyma flocculosa]|uniref:Uncharacterized protein n=1 Tax=Pseudozyma flocculosa TaxID=84751 RepID=A0A5C3ETF7_9BASI|nr:uncharacterized protein PSFLO_01114 [Pseudozyma flocculosa]